MTLRSWFKDVQSGFTWFRLTVHEQTLKNKGHIDHPHFFCVAVPNKILVLWVLVPKRAVFALQQGPVRFSNPRSSGSSLDLGTNGCGKWATREANASERFRKLCFFVCFPD